MASSSDVTVASGVGEPDVYLADLDSSSDPEDTSTTSS